MSWRRAALKNLGQIIGGGTPSTKEPFNFGDDYPWITPKDLSRQGQRYIDHGERGISIEGLARSSAKLLPAGSVIVSSRAPIGLTAIATVPVTTNQGCRSFIPGKDADSLFMYYLLGSITDQMERLANGSTFKEISGSTLAAIEVSVPDLEEQREIAATLGALDDKIESNRRKIRTMESLGSSLLQSRLEFDKSGFPKYLETQCLGDFLTVLETGSRPKGGVEEGDVGMISLGAESIQSAGVLTTKKFKRIPDDFSESMTRGHLEELDILVYKDGGRPGNFIPHISAFGQGFPASAATINEHVFRVRSGHGISQGLLYWLLRSSWMDQEMRNRGTGVAIPGLNSSNFRELPVPVMSKSIIDDLSEALTPLLTLMLHTASVSAKLSALRDAILPELLSGRTSVADTSKLTHEVVA